MRRSKIKGVIKRRVLANFRADPEVTRRILPSAFRPKLHAGNAIVGICILFGCKPVSFRIHPVR